MSNESEAEKAAREYLKGIPLSDRSSVYEETQELERMAFLAGVEWERKRVATEQAAYAKRALESFAAITEKYQQIKTVDGGRVISEDE
jgi:hypothetical protein